MKTKVIDGKEIMVFDNREELKWHYHEKLCHGDSTAEYLMDQCVKEEDVNKWLKRMGESCRVEEP